MYSKLHNIPPVRLVYLTVYGGTVAAETVVKETPPWSRQGSNVQEMRALIVLNTGEIILEPTQAHASTSIANMNHAKGKAMHL